MSETPVMDELVRELKRINASDWTIDLIRKGQELERELAAERERADRNQRDAERYQWLRMNRLWLKANLPMIHAGEFDAAIDAARRK